MMKRILLSTLIIALSVGLIAGTAAAEEEDFAERIRQFGENNEARLEASDEEAVSVINQRGEDNEAYITQKAGGRAEINQAENTYGNNARINQNSENADTIAVINQVEGSQNNHAEIVQTTEVEVSARIHQEGENNTARITQTD